MPLTFTIETAAGEQEYTIPPVGWASGKELLGLLTMAPEKAAKSKQDQGELFALVLSKPLWDQLLADGAEYVAMYRLGLAALAHFRARAEGLDEQAARAAFDTIRKSGVDPEALAAQVAAIRASSTTSPATAAAASSTKRRASMSGTTARKQPAPRSSRRSNTGR